MSDADAEEIVHAMRKLVDHATSMSQMLLAQNVANRAILVALLEEHPAPAKVLERYLCEIDRCAEHPGVCNQTFAKYFDSYRDLLDGLVKRR